MAVSKQTNGIDIAAATEYVERIENLNDEIASAKGEYMNIAKARREDIGHVLTEAKDEHGIPKKALKAIIKQRELESKIKALVDMDDMDDQAAFEQLREALGEFGNTPLGQAALDERAPDPDSSGVKPTEDTYQTVS